MKFVDLVSPKQFEDIGGKPVRSDASLDIGTIKAEGVKKHMRFVKESLIRASPERVFEFHEQADVLSLLLPPWESARVITPAKISEVGSQAVVETSIFGPITMRWIAEHTIYDPPRVFEDIQIKGPFRSWRHRHVVESRADGALLRDEINYEPLLGFLGRAFSPLLVERRLRKLFDYRHEVTRRWCEALKEVV